LNLDEIIRGKDPKNCFVSEITVFELRYGAENSKNPTKSHKAVDLFINGITVIPIYSSIKKYAKEKVRLRKMGKPMNDEFDLLIGVTAVENKLTLITDNEKDFVNIEDLTIENWFERK
jgi:tRNA(fMet)-specific endonuclease VapC